jgi:hypothetical protein
LAEQLRVAQLIRTTGVGDQHLSERYDLIRELLVSLMPASYAFSQLCPRF